MNYIDALLSFYRVVIRRTVSIIRRNQSFNLAILGNFVIVFGVLFAELSTSTRQTRVAMAVQQALNN